MDNKKKGMSISFNDQHFEKLDVVDDQSGQSSFLYKVDGVEVSEEEWGKQQEVDIEPCLASLHIS